MKFRTFFAFSAALVVATTACAQDYRAEFNTFALAKDSVGQRAALEKWEAARPKDPELFVAQFNYYAQRSKQEVLSLETEPFGGEDDGFAVVDSLGNNVGYLGGRTFYSPELGKAFAAIEKGIALYPDRLDMRFGRIYMFGESKSFDAFTQAIVETVHYSAVNKNNWIWTDNKPLSEPPISAKDPKEFMLASIQNYVIQLFNEGEGQLANMRKIPEAILEHYPDHIESLSNLAITYMLTNDFNGALKPLLKAEKLAPKDGVVLGNIAWSYKNAGDDKHAKKYYEKVLKYGDREAQAYAKEQLKELDKK